MSNRNAPRRAFLSRCAALLIATTALGACANPADNAVGESSSSESSASSATFPAALQLDYTMVEPTMDTIDFVKRVDYLEPVSAWVGESTLRVGWYGATYCPSKPVSISHDGSGNLMIELDYDPPGPRICEAAGQVFIADFHFVPRPDSGESHVTLLGPEAGMTQVVTVDS